MIAYLALLYHSPEGGVMEYLESMYLPLCAAHPPTAHPTSTLLQCMRSLCNSGCAHTVYVSSEYPHYVCACAPVPHVIVFKQFACLIYSLAHIQYMRAYIQRYCKYMQTHTTPTKQRGRSSHSTHLGRQVGSQHIFITGLVILPNVQTNELLPTVT